MIPPNLFVDSVLWKPIMKSTIDNHIEFMKRKTIEIVSLHDYEKIIKNYDTNKVFFYGKVYKKALHKESR